MADLISAPQHFTTVNYVTKEGEKVSATKNNGVVTLVGDKKGTRQMSIDEFKQELIQNSAKIELEKTPAKDTVEISSTANKANEPQKDEADEKATDTKPAEIKSAEVKAEETADSKKVEDKKEEETPKAESKKDETKTEPGKKLDVNA